MILCLYGYDPLDRLASTSRSAGMTRHFYQTGRPVSEVELQRWRTLLLADQIPLAQVQFPATGMQDALLATDRQHSVLAALLPGQRVDIAYAPCGHQPPAGTWPGFNGQPRDPSTGHYLLGNGYRAYNPVLGRFNSPDNLSPFGKGGINAYAYCEGDPLNLTDPDGHFGVDVAAGYAWSLLAFGRSTKAFKDSLPTLKRIFKGTPSDPSMPRTPLDTATNLRKKIVNVLSAATSLAQWLSGVLAFGASTAKLAGGSAAGYTGAMIPAVVTGAGAFGLQMGMGKIGDKLQAYLVKRYSSRVESFEMKRIRTQGSASESIPGSASGNRPGSRLRRKDSTGSRPGSSLSAVYLDQERMDETSV